MRWKELKSGYIVTAPKSTAQRKEQLEILREVEERREDVTLPEGVKREERQRRKKRRIV
jgi:hypothetical protein